MRSRGVLVLSAIVVFGQAASLSAQAPSPVLSAADGLLDPHSTSAQRSRLFSEDSGSSLPHSS